MFSKTLIAAFGLAAIANAHLAIQVPEPVTASAPKDPLDPSGSNFPCHGADLSTGTVTTMAVGSQQPLHFNLGGGANTAVHGGGSCQIALTYETDAAKRKDPANWKVIHSFIGACPTDAKGNLGTSVECPVSDPACVNSFNFVIPEEAKSGNAILAWTWFNNVGNREMYMNCARVNIPGTNAGNLASLPSLFVANLASYGQCATSENFNTDFPNPGKYVSKDSSMNYPLKAPVGSGCGSGSGSANVAASPASPASGSSGSSPAAAASPAAASANNGQYTGIGASSPKAPTVAKATASAKQTQTAAGAFAQGAAPASTLATAVVPAASTPTATPAAAVPAAQAPAAAAPAASSSGSGSCASGSVACTASGFYCIDATHFGQCAFGCAVPMQMAAGTNCANGAVTFAASKRSASLRHAMKHMRRQIIGA